MAEAIRPPSGDWLGTRFLRFERRGPFGVCIIDRPAKRNALTGAMYFGIRYAVEHVDRDPDLAGLLLTGTGDVFAPGGDLSGDNEDGWADLPNLLGMENTPFDALRQSVKPVVSAVNGICQGGGLIIAMLSDMAVVSDRAVFRAPELYRGIADTHYAQILARQIGPARAPTSSSPVAASLRPKRWSGDSSAASCRTIDCSKKPKRCSRNAAERLRRRGRSSSAASISTTASTTASA